MYQLQVVFLVFIIYSIIGWVLEIISCYRIDHRIINRGFLIGPYCPIYGVGAIIMTILIRPSNDIFAIFLKAMAICSILEYITSYLMEKMFKTRWWDYSKKPFNINGRICLETMVLFGLGGVAIIAWSNPIIYGVIYSLNHIALLVIFIVSFIIFTSDLIISYNIIKNFKKLPKDIRKDSTEEITNMVRKELKKKGYFSKRLVYSFPDFKSIVYNSQEEKLKEELKNIKQKLNEIDKNNDKTV